MTNAKYHRRVRALARLSQETPVPLGRRMERDMLTRLVEGYRAGAYRAKNGRGAGLHPSGAAA